MRRVARTTHSPLEWLRDRRDKAGNPLISNEEYAAGVRLRTDFEKAQMQPHTTANWSGLPDDRSRRSAPGAGLDLLDHVVAAKERINKAIAAVGVEHGNLLLDVCCFETGLTHVERTFGWPQRSGKVILQLALRQLARHYGMLPPEAAGQGSGMMIRRWGDQGYRGSLDTWTEATDQTQGDGS